MASGARSTGPDVDGFVRVARLKEIKPGQVREAMAGKSKLSLANVNGNYYAFAANCPHQGWPLSETACSIFSPGLRKEYNSASAAGQRR